MMPRQTIMAERVVRNVEQDYLICSICLDRYEDPKLIPCGHSFCKRCLRDHIVQTVTDRRVAYFKCPIDRKKIGRPDPNLRRRDWADAFPVDSFLESLLNAVHLHDGSASNKTNGLYCSKHSGRALEYFCIGCNVSACSDCLVKFHKKRGCDCVTANDALKHCDSRVKNLLRRLEQQIREIDRKMENNESERFLQKDKKQAIHVLDDLSRQLTDFYEKKLFEIDEAKRRISEQGQGQTEVNRQLSILTCHIRDTKISLEDLYNLGPRLDTLNDLPTIEAQINEYDYAMQVANERQDLARVNFVPNENLKRLLKDSRKIGKIEIIPMIRLLE